MNLFIWTFDSFSSGRRKRCLNIWLLTYSFYMWMNDLCDECLKEYNFIKSSVYICHVIIAIFVQHYIFSWNVFSDVKEKCLILLEIKTNKERKYIILEYWNNTKSSISYHSYLISFSLIGYSKYTHSCVRERQELLFWLEAFEQLAIPLIHQGPIFLPNVFKQLEH